MGSKHWIALLVLIVVSGSLLAQRRSRSSPSPQPAPVAPLQVDGAPVRLASGVEYWDIRKGTGGAAVAGMRLKVHYTGWLTNGKKFDSSFDRGEPFTFQLGKHRVIRGLEEGLKGMRVGGIRQVRVPPEMAYGKRGSGAEIPPNSTLVFDVELLGTY